jgi:hypothetical protein
MRNSIKSGLANAGARSGSTDARLLLRLRRRGAAVEPLEARRLLAASIAVTDFSGGIEIPDGDGTPSVEEGTDFGESPVGLGRPFRSFQVTNTSTTDDLTLAGLSVPAGFQVEKALPDVLGPGASDFFTISLLDDAQEPRAGAVQFNTNVPGVEQFDFSVAGSFVPATAEPDNLFEDVPTFADTDSVSFQGGTTPEGIPVAVPVNRLLRFNVPDGQAQVSFRIDATGGIADGASADVEVVVVRDADQDGMMSLGELAAPVTSFVAPVDAGEQATQATLPAGGYFVLLRAANFTVTDPGVEQPGVRADYTLNASVSAVVPPDVAVRFGGPAAATVVADGDATPSPEEGTHFGSAQVGQAGVSRQFVVTNTGGGTLTLGGVTVTGGFRLAAAPAASLNAGESSTFTVEMLTAAVGPQAGSVGFATNVPGMDPYDFALAGDVTETAPAAAPEVTVLLEDGTPVAAGQAEPVAFGASVQGQAGAVRQFTIRNDGTAPLNLGAITAPAGFTVTEAPAVAALAPGASATFTVTISTATSGARAGTLGVATDDADENPFAFAVRGVVGQPGSAVTPDIAVLLEGAALTSGAPIDFGSREVGGAAPERAVTLRNDGSGVLALGQITLPDGYTLAQGPDEASLAPGASTTIRIALGTATAGTFAGDAAIASNDGDENPFTLSLSGAVTAAPAPPSVLTVGEVTGKVPAVVIAGDRRARGSVAFTVASRSGEAFAGPVTFTARASADALNGPADVELATVTRNVKLKAGAARTMRLKFKFPESLPEGDKQVLVTATPAGAAPGGQTPGVGVGPGVSVQTPFVRLTGLPAAAPAGVQMTFGKRARVTVPLQNAGNVPTTRTPATYTLSVSTDGTTAGEVFVTTAPGKLNLKPGASRPQKLTVTFPPGAFAPGSYTLIVRLTAELNETNGDVAALIPFTIA